MTDPLKHGATDPVTEAMPERNKPLVYSGRSSASPSDRSAPFAGNTRMRGTRRRPLNPSSIFLVLMGLAVAIVLYVSNIIAVNQLLLDINALETEHHEILMEQERLKAQINRLASLERIQERAETELGLKSLREPPIWLDVDQDLIRDLEERARP